MDLRKKCGFILTVILIISFAQLPAAPTEDKNEKIVLSLKDYPRWQHIVSPLISSDGK